MTKIQPRWFLLILIFLLSACSLRTRSILPQQAGDYTIRKRYNGVQRSYIVHIPQGYSSQNPAALVFAFHGGGGNSEIMANDTYYGWISKSEQEGFIVVFPNGVSPLRDKLATWNAGNCCGLARDENSDDVGFVQSIVNEVTKSLTIDPDRIYAAGMSNGGMFVYRLACELSETFTAVASVAGTDNTRICDPTQPVSILHIHALNDGHVLFGGGAGAEAFRDEEKVTDFVSVPETIALWTGHNQCRGEAQRVFETQGAYCDLYQNCSGESEVQLCVTEEGAHSWPGANGVPREVSDQCSQALNATDVIWTFFEQN